MNSLICFVRFNALQCLVAGFTSWDLVSLCFGGSLDFVGYSALQSLVAGFTSCDLVP